MINFQKLNQIAPENHCTNCLLETEQMIEEQTIPEERGLKEWFENFQKDYEHIFYSFFLSLYSN